MLNLTSAMALIPFLLVAAYGVLDAAKRGETYETRPQERKRDLIIAWIAVVYTLFLFFAAGMKFLLLSAILFAPGHRRSTSGRGASRASRSSPPVGVGHLRRRGHRRRRRHLRARDRLHHHLSNG